MTKETLSMYILFNKDKVVDWMLANADCKKLEDYIIAQTKSEQIARLEADIPKLQAQLDGLKTQV